MYSSVHSAVGVASYLVMKEFGLPNWSIYLTAFLSHHFMDHIGERGCYGGFWKGVVIDGLLLQGVVVGTAFYLIGPEAAICGLLANAMDFYDKYRSKIQKKKEIFPCHQPTHAISLQLNAKQTLLTNFLSTSAIIAWMALLNYIR